MHFPKQYLSLEKTDVPNGQSGIMHITEEMPCTILSCSVQCFLHNCFDKFIIPFIPFISLCCSQNYAAGFVFYVVLPVFCSVPDSLLSLCPPNITEELFQLSSLDTAILHNTLNLFVLV